jgi:hypothetical protein
MVSLSLGHLWGYEMNAITQTALETAVLERLHEVHRGAGFPPPGQIRVLKRENTPGGRYVDIASDAEVKANDGYIDLGGRFIEMEGLANGMMAVALVQDRRLKILEFSVYGGDSWNGEERAWKIV